MLFDVCCALLVDCCPLIVVGFVLSLVVRCLSYHNCCALSVDCCSLRLVCCCWLSRVVCCSLCVVVCLSIV